MDAGHARAVAWLATAVGVVALVSVTSLALFYVVGSPFGPINDWTVGLVGVLSVLLVLMLRGGGTDEAKQGGMAPAALGVVGSAIAVIGTALVISDATGFLLAGLVESLGFALVGLWLVAFNRSPARAAPYPAGLRTLGIAAGAVMAVGIVAAPGIAMGVDDVATAPPFVWIGTIPDGSPRS
jgi:hypothetical protein